MALEKLKRGCPYGKEITAEIEAGGNESIIARLDAVEVKAGGKEAIIARLDAVEVKAGGKEAIIARLDAIEAKIAAVLAATAEDDDGKTLQIDSNGKVALVTVG